jgi:hypothetical protein
MAFEQVTDLTTNKTTYEMPGYSLKPDETTHPSRMNSTWKQFATKNNGVAVFYSSGLSKNYHLIKL